MKCTVHDLEVMSLNPGWVKHEVQGTSKLYLIPASKSLNELFYLFVVLKARGEFDFYVAEFSATLDLHFRHESKLPVCQTRGLNQGTRQCCKPLHHRCRSLIVIHFLEQILM